MAAMPRMLAYYLPQFHPIPENDEWWGRGFTEWTNTAKAKPRFSGHYQPHVPADLGFYDLRVAETRVAQAAMARKYGIEGFCYYHYWFGAGRKLLERPFQEVLSSGEPDFPFCLCWANDTWTGIWHGAPNKTLIEQRYPGVSDDESHFNTLLPAFEDSRYIRVDGKPVLLVWRPFGFPDPAAMVRRWQSMAIKAGLPGLFLIGIYRVGGPDPEAFGFDASVHNGTPPLRPWGSWKSPAQMASARLQRALGRPTVVDYRKSMEYFLPEVLPETRYPSLVHAWDNTPRSGVNGLVLKNGTPEIFAEMLRRAFALTRTRTGPDDSRLIFLKSWNEWAEGNHLEPDLRDGLSYLEVVKREYDLEVSSHC